MKKILTDKMDGATRLLMERDLKSLVSKENIPKVIEVIEKNILIPSDKREVFDARKIAPC